VVDLVHSGRKGGAVARGIVVRVPAKEERLVTADTVGALLQAGKKLTSPRIRIQIEVPELHLDARLFVHRLRLRGCLEARGGKHTESAIRRRERDEIWRLMFRLLRTQGAR